MLAAPEAALAGEAALAAARAAERAAVGFCLSGHPVSHAAAEVQAAGAASLADALRAGSGERVVAAATVLRAVERRTRRGEWMAVLWLEDARTRCEATCFPKAWSRAFSAVLSGGGAASAGCASDPDRVLLLTAARDREPGRLVVEAAAPLAPLPDPRAAQLGRLRRDLGDFVVLDVETCLGPEDGAGGKGAGDEAGGLVGGSEPGEEAAAGRGTGESQAVHPLAGLTHAAAPREAAKGRGRAGGTAVPTGLGAALQEAARACGARAGAAGAASAAGAAWPDPGSERADEGWLRQQRVVEVGAAFFRRVRGRPPRQGEAAGPDGLVPQWAEVKRLSRLCDPGCPIDEESRRVHGISDADVAGQPTFAERAPGLAKVLREWPTVVTYNGRRFDEPVLRREFERAGVAPRWPTHADAADLVARRYPGRVTRPASNRLGDQCAFWGVPLVGAHRASEDAAATGQLLVRLLQAAT